MELPKSWNISDYISIRLNKRTAGHQRAIIGDGEALLILHKPPSKKDLERTVVLFWRNPAGEWKHGEHGDGIKQLGFHLDEYHKTEERIEKNYAKASNADDYFALLEDLAPLQRSTKNMHIALQEIRENFQDDNELIGIRDLAYEVRRNMELFYIDTKNKVDYYLAKQAELQAKLAQDAVESSQRLNNLAAIFLPITAMASIFGMNVKIGFEATPYWPFIFILGSGLISGFLLRNWVSHGKLGRIGKIDHQDIIEDSNRENDED
ncbi:MAG: hypothetical protein COA79_19940 [Planctomycetota bacterium]|nr:MAG: hypothetical protein COA79_19940 [Planctomycetota bacterium]